MPLATGFAASFVHLLTVGFGTARNRRDDGRLAQYCEGKRTFGNRQSAAPRGLRQGPRPIAWRRRMVRAPAKAAFRPAWELALREFFGRLDHSKSVAFLNGFLSGP